MTLYCLGAFRHYFSFSVIIETPQDQTHTLPATLHEKN